MLDFMKGQRLLWLAQLHSEQATRRVWRHQRNVNSKEPVGAL